LGDADTFNWPIKDFFPFQPFRSDDFPAQFYTFVTDEDAAWPSNEVFYLVSAFVTEGAVQNRGVRVLMLLHTILHFRLVFSYLAFYPL
jgi:hypothetical protein